jgi:hypothetical protein
MLTRIILALVSFLLTRMAMAAQLGLALTVSPGSSGNTPFTALHTYYISPTGSDSNSGTSAATPWLTPNHSGIVCGDVIIAAKGAYSSANFDSYSHGSSLWATPSSCPSTSGGIDGTGGVYFATIVCGGSYVGACTINAATAYSMDVSSSNWAVEGFQASNETNGDGACFIAQPLKVTSVSFVAFINDIAENCPLTGVSAGAYPGASTPSVDEFAAVGNIAFNAAQSAAYCGSGLGDLDPIAGASFSGTHVYFSQNFSYGNVNGPCSVNSIGKGAYTTASSNYNAGVSSIGVAAVSGWWANWPIGASGNGSTWPYSSTAIPSPTFVSSVSGTTIRLSNNVASPGLTSGQLLEVGTTTDGEGITFDTWGINSYAAQAVVENNVLWGNGGNGFEMFCNPTCASGLSVSVLNNTIYGNLQDYKHDGVGAEIYDNDQSGSWTFAIQNNLIQSDVTKPTNSRTEAPWNGTSGVGGAGTGQPVVSVIFGRTGMTVSGNYFASASGATCPTYATCDGGNNIGQYNGVSYTSGNTFSLPGFASPGSLPTTVPNCSSYANVVACMNTGYGVAAALTSSAAPGKGYQTPAATCQPDANYPNWLKGIVYLQWTGSAVVQQHGLVTTPCGL